MTIIAEERHYRRGLVLGLTISELMLLLLFILMLLMSYTLKQGRDQMANAQAAAEQDYEKLKQDYEKLKKDKGQLAVALAEAQAEANSNKALANELEQSNRDLWNSIYLLENEIAALQKIIDDSPSLSESQADKAEAKKVPGLEQANEILRDEVEGLRDQLDGTAARMAQALLDGMYNSRKDLIDGILGDLTKGGMENASPDYEDGVLRLPQDVLFDSGEGQLSFSGEEAVDLLAEALRKWVPCYTVAHAWACEEQGVPENAAKLSAVFIEGHTDNKPVVNEETVRKYRDNWGLSSARAISAFNRLVSRKPELQTYMNSEGQRLLSISGYADNRQAADNWTPEGREKNRRIDVRFIFAPNADAARSEVTTGVSGAIPALIPKVGN
jgi:chemotaxis protein MotB